MRSRSVACALALLLVVVVGSTAVTAQTSTEGFQVVGGVSEADRFEGAESLTGRLAETDSSLLDRSSSKLVNVIVKLDYDPLAVYDGSIEGLSATSPSVTGRPLDRGSAAIRRYTRYVEDFEAEATNAIESRVPQAQIGQ
ncbi:MAG TPA: serine protease, partial [Actinomycetota bacterium]|nr:serine protease [Actinomycetota bacterium]